MDEGLEGFFYSRYPEPPQDKVLEAALSGQALYYHRVGTPQSEDRLIYERKDLPTWFIGGDVTEDGRYLLDHDRAGLRQQEPPVRRRPRRPDAAEVSTAPITPVVETDDAEYAPIGNEGSVLFLRTDLDAPNRRVIAVDSEASATGARGRPSLRNARRRSRSSPSRAAASSPSISSTCRAGCMLFGLDGTAGRRGQAAGRRLDRAGSAAARIRA